MGNLIIMYGYAGFKNKKKKRAYLKFSGLSRYI